MRLSAFAAALVFAAATGTVTAVYAGDCDYKKDNNDRVELQNDKPVMLAYGYKSYGDSKEKKEAKDKSDSKEKGSSYGY